MSVSSDLELLFQSARIDPILRDAVERVRAAYEASTEALKDAYPYVNAVALDPAHRHDWRGELANEFLLKMRGAIDA